ncbi:MAG: hypothetical protein AB7V42_02565 [Thermoleophilia bacterium]
MRPIAPLALELRTTGVGQLVIGAIGLVVALIRDDVAPARAIIPFVATFVALAAVSSFSSKWLRSGETGPASEEARVEIRSETIRRCSISLLIGAAAVGAGIAAGGGLSAVLGGVLCGVGLVDLLNLRSVRARERADGTEVFRELGASPFAGGRRPLYTRPRNASTLST